MNTEDWRPSCISCRKLAMRFQLRDIWGHYCSGTCKEAAAVRRALTGPSKWLVKVRAARGSGNHYSCTVTAYTAEGARAVGILTVAKSWNYLASELACSRVAVYSDPLSDSAIEWWPTYGPVDWGAL